jgi:hypothetical protein
VTGAACNFGGYVASVGWVVSRLGLRLYAGKLWSLCYSPPGIGRLIRYLICLAVLERSWNLTLPLVYKWSVDTL